MHYSRRLRLIYTTLGISSVKWINTILIILISHMKHSVAKWKNSAGSDHMSVKGQYL